MEQQYSIVGNAYSLKYLGQACKFHTISMLRGVARGGLGGHLPLHHFSLPPINFKCLINYPY